jgi:hypothetical protein
MRKLFLPSMLVVFGLAMFLSATALASTTVDIRGTFNAQGQGGSPYTITLTDEDCSTGVVSGTASGGVGPEHGTLNGNQLTLHEAYGGYTSDITATVSADNKSISGTFHDSNNVTAPWTATRTSGPPATPPPGCSASPPPPPPPPGARATSTSVSCSAAAGAGSGTQTCTATVGDSGAPPRTTPTGTVSFTSAAAGTFSAGASCTLTPTPNSPGVASCSVQYTPPTGGPTAITATYGGDSSHTGSTGSTQAAAGQQRPTGTTVSCNYFFDTGTDTCIATVGDGGPPPRTTPTGTTSFSSDNAASSRRAARAR